MAVTHTTFTHAIGELYVTPKPVLYDVPSKLLNLRSTQPPPETRRLYNGRNGKLLGSATSGAELPKKAKKLIGTKTFRYAKAKNYLKQRGFGKRYWKRYNLGYMDSRIIIPIEDDYWQGRSLFDYMYPKYMAPNIPSAHVLFNAQALNKYKEIVITEGAFSAMAVGDNAVALVGKNPTKEKVNRLLSAGIDKFIIVLEEDARSMLKLADIFKARGIDVVIWHYLDATDPADWGQPEVYRYTLRKKVEFLLNL